MINSLNTSSVKQQRDWFQSLLNYDNPDLLGNHFPWFNHLRQDARKTITELPLVERKQEFWRYSLTERIFKKKFYPLENKIANIHDKELNPDLSSDSFKLVFVNGHFNAALSDSLSGDSSELPKGVIAGSLIDVLRAHPKRVKKCFEQTARHNEHLFTVLNTALMNYGVFIYIDKQVEMKRPIEVVYLSSPLGENSDNHEPGVNDKDDMQMATLRNIIVLEAGAKVSLIERYSGDQNSYYFNNNRIDVLVNEGATIKHSFIQDESRSAFHLSSLYLTLCKESTYKGLHIALGGAWSRMEYNVSFTEVGARCDLKGLYTVGNQQLNDIHLNIAHHVPDCTSSELFKGILYGEGRAVFDGHVVVEKQAQHSDASMKNDNLILSGNAEVDTKPQLEIYADDVKCSHGTTVGQLDEQQLFYLRSRGINKAEAKKILCKGFASEVIEEIEEPILRKQVENKLTETLNDVVSFIAQENSP